MADAEMEAELQGLQAGEESRGSNAPQTGDGCLEALWQQFVALGANGIETFAQRLQKEMGAAQGQRPLVYGVYLVKAEVQEDHTREVHLDRQDGLLWDDDVGELVP